MAKQPRRLVVTQVATPIESSICRKSAEIVHIGSGLVPKLGSLVKAKAKCVACVGKWLQIVFVAPGAGGDGGTARSSTGGQTAGGHARPWPWQTLAESGTVGYGGSASAEIQLLLHRRGT